MSCEIKPGLYRHYKGSMYRVIGIACDTDSSKIFVVYHPEGCSPEDTLWARTIPSWTNPVLGSEAARFERIEEKEALHDTGSESDLAPEGK